MASPTTEPVDFYLEAARRHAKLSVFGALLGVVLGLAWTYLQPPLYRAETTFLVASVDASIDNASPFGPQPVQILRGIASSLELQDRVAKELQITPRYVSERLQVNADAQRNQLTLFAETKSKAESIRLLQSVERTLPGLAREVGLGPAGREVGMLEAAVAEREKLLQQAQGRLAEAQRESPAAVDPNDPATALLYARNLRDLETRAQSLEIQIREKRRVLSAAGRDARLPSALTQDIPLRQELLNAEFEFANLSSRFTPENEEYRRAQEALNALRERYESEVTKRLAAAEQGLDVQLGQLLAERDALQVQMETWKGLAQRAPDDAIKILRLAFEVQAQEAILRELREQLEIVQVQAQVDGIRWSVLTPTTAMPEPTNKNYLLNGLVGGLLGLFLMGAIGLARSSGSGPLPRSG